MMNYKYFFNNRNNILLAIFVLFFFLVINTGLQGDDYWMVKRLADNDLFYFFSLSPDDKGQFLFASTGWYLYFWSYILFNDSFLFGYDIIKIIFNLILFYFVYKFGSLYFCKTKSVLFSLIFLLFPTHDSTFFWLMTIKHVLGPCALLYLYYLVEKKSNYFLIIPTFLSCFISYATPPFAAALSLSFLIRKKYKKFIIFTIPSALYFLIYIFFHLFSEIEIRITKDLDITFLLKNFILQIGSLIDTFFGPSFIFKIFLSIKELSTLNIFLIIIFLPFLYLLWKTIKKNEIIKIKNFNSIFIISFLIVIFSIIMFMLTGKYNHSPFNLVNRTTVYFAFFISVILTAYLKKENLYLFFVVIVLIPTLGLSDHWKKINKDQNIIYKNIEKNVDLKNIDIDNSIVVTKGFNYSKLGNFSHVEVFAMPWHVTSIFEIKTGIKNALPLTDTLKVDQNKIYDTKFDQNTISTKISHNYKNRQIYLYEVMNNNLQQINIDKLKLEINNKEKDFRHWIQLPFVSKFLKKYIIYLSPRLNYLF